MLILKIQAGIPGRFLILFRATNESDMPMVHCRKRAVPKVYINALRRNSRWSSLGGTRGIWRLWYLEWTCRGLIALMAWLRGAALSTSELAFPELSIGGLIQGGISRKATCLTYPACIQLFNLPRLLHYHDSGQTCSDQSAPERIRKIHKYDHTLTGWVPSLCESLYIGAEDQQEDAGNENLTQAGLHLLSYGIIKLKPGEYRFTNWGKVFESCNRTAPGPHVDVQF